LCSEIHAAPFEDAQAEDIDQLLDWTTEGSFIPLLHQKFEAYNMSPCHLYRVPISVEREPLTDGFLKLFTLPKKAILPLYRDGDSIEMTRRHVGR
jgi:hypothetical protein